MAVKKRQQKGADVTAIYVRVCHQNDPVIADFRGIKIIRADARTQSHNQGADLLRPQHAIKACALHIQHLSPQRQNGLKHPVASLLGRAAGAVSLNNKKFTEGGIFLRTVRQFPRQRGNIESAFSAGQFSGAAGCFPCHRCFKHVRYNLFAFGRVFLKPLLKFLGDQLLHNRPHFRGN